VTKKSRKRRQPPDGSSSEADPAHAPGKRKKGPPVEPEGEPTEADLEPRRHEPWVPTSGLVGRKRRSPRRG